uniref:transposase n=1 Tax=Cyclobacterium marinum TaxID=104 RepID=UPI001F55535C|nr:transposase [Cyclobacterium marinum]
MGSIKNSDCTLYQINGIGNHIHLLTDLNPTISLSNFIKSIKVASSMWMRQQKNFPL